MQTSTNSHVHQDLLSPHCTSITMTGNLVNNGKRHEGTGQWQQVRWLVFAYQFALVFWVPGVIRLDAGTVWPTNFCLAPLIFQLMDARQEDDDRTPVERILSGAPGT